MISNLRLTAEGLHSLMRLQMSEENVITANPHLVGASVGFWVVSIKMSNGEKLKSSVPSSYAVELYLRPFDKKWHRGDFTKLRTKVQKIIRAEEV